MRIKLSLDPKSQLPPSTFHTCVCGFSMHSCIHSFIPSFVCSFVKHLLRRDLLGVVLLCSGATVHSYGKAPRIWCKFLLFHFLPFLFFHFHFMTIILLHSIYRKSYNKQAYKHVQRKCQTCPTFSLTSHHPSGPCSW